MNANVQISLFGVVEIYYAIEVLVLTGADVVVKNLDVMAVISHLFSYSIHNPSGFIYLVKIARSSADVLAMS
jgi:hypothetical protein